MHVTRLLALLALAAAACGGRAHPASPRPPEPTAASTTRDPDTGVTDLKTLHFLKHSRDGVDSFEPLPFGVYGEVLEPGPVRIGDPVGLAG